jgi:hypothetical protein
VRQVHHETLLPKPLGEQLGGFAIVFYDQRPHDEVYDTARFGSRASHESFMIP